MSKQQHWCATRRDGFITWLNSAVVFLLLQFGMMSAVKAESCYPMNSAQLNFGTYNPEYAEHLDSVTSIDIYCAPAFNGQTLDVRVTVNGVSSYGDYRVMNNLTAKDQAHFILYQDAARTIPLTDQMAIPISESVPRSKIFTIRLYGRMFARQDVSVGTYMANLMINIDY